MKVSNSDYSRYDSRIDTNSKTEQIKSTNKIKSFLQAFRVDLSQRAIESKEYNDPTINFPTYNTDVLQYSENLNLIFKP